MLPLTESHFTLSLNNDLIEDKNRAVRLPFAQRFIFQQRAEFYLAPAGGSSLNCQEDDEDDWHKIQLYETTESLETHCSYMGFAVFTASGDPRCRASLDSFRI